MLVVPPRGQGEDVLGEGGDVCKWWAKYLGGAVLSEACTEPTGTTQAPLCGSGSTPTVSWSSGERPQRHKGRTCVGLGVEAEYVRVHGLPCSPRGATPGKCACQGGRACASPRTTALSGLLADACTHGKAPKLCACGGGGFQSFRGRSTTPFPLPSERRGPLLSRLCAP